jgi:DNA-binding HxlR family transcriptional regulator
MVIINSKESLQKNHSFQRIKKGLPGISSTVLSDRLLELEREGLISKKTFSEIPPKVEYRMTPQARDLETIMNELGKWANRWKSSQLQKTKF